MKNCLFCLVSRVLLTRTTSQANILLYRDLARADTEYTTWFWVWPLVTNSVPTLTLGLSRPLSRSPALMPSRKATFSASEHVERKGEHA